MKKFTLILVVLIAMSFNANAQITNNGFENWTTIGNYQNPTGWATMNAACAGPFYSCTKSTDHYPVSVGSYSMRVENNTSLTQQTGGWGMIVTDSMAYPFQPAFPIVGHPNSLCGYYKYLPQNSDSMWIRIIFFENGVMGNSNTFYSGISASTWTSFTIPLSYNIADSATILIAAFYPGGPTSGPKGNSVLYVDNLSFDNLINSVSSATIKNTTFSLYPNPAYDRVTLNTIILNNNPSTLRIFNTLGELVKTELLHQNQQQVDISNLLNGVYIFEIQSAERIEKQELFIQR